MYVKLEVALHLRDLKSIEAERERIVALVKKLLVEGLNTDFESDVEIEIIESTHEQLG